MKRLTGSILLFCMTLVIILVRATACAQGWSVEPAPLPQAAEEVLGAAAGGKLYVFA